MNRGRLEELGPPGGTPCDAEQAPHVSCLALTIFLPGIGSAKVGRHSGAPKRVGEVTEPGANSIVRTDELRTSSYVLIYSLT